MENKIFLGKYRVSAGEVALSDAGEVPAVERGNNAVVYRGEQIDSGQDVILEVIPATPFKSAVREQLEAEALSARKLNHINIPALYDFGIEDDQLIYVTEYFEGTSAEEWVNAHGPMPTAAVLRIALQVMGAMGAAAFHKISHHAINPANLLLVPGQTPEGDWPLVKVLRFVGVAPQFASADLAVAAFDKSSHYASPEQLQDGKVDFRSEIYSLGATMWFLLAGAAPLILPKGPLAIQPTALGLTVDRLNGMPKRVQRLLAQMLAVDPNARPQDPLAFYRQIQECIAQVDRRETMARKFGVPLLSGSNPAPLPGQRRFPAKALALAATLLAIAALAAILVPRYLHHERVRNAEEPIGVPIGVSDATSPAPPATTETTAVAVTNPAPLPETSVAGPNQNQNPPPQSVTPESAPVTPTNTAPVVAANEAISAPPPPVAPAAPKMQTTEEQPRVAANDNTVRPLPTAVPENTPARQLATAPKPAESLETTTNAPAAERNLEVASTIPTARPVSPEVRRAEPAPPGEGPEEVASMEPSKRTESAESVAPSETSNAEKSADPAAVVLTRIPKSEPKTERVAKTKRDAKRPQRQASSATDSEESDAPPSRPLPRGQVKARFIGVTPDGQWMLSLPSKKIVVVPPPPGG